ncbi:MAG: hypothetical protein KAS32_28715 [Candidatus Peribacteraceae bacterium]|nr:hypothetical protein [Candidatus Peribacteraceae bacterium]
MMESFMIAEHYVPKDELVKVAKAILLAQDLREDSWDGEVKTYTKTSVESSTESVNTIGLKSVWAEIILGWNFHMWNDSQAWAQDIIEKFDIDDTVDGQS